MKICEWEKKNGEEKGILFQKQKHNILKSAYPNILNGIYFYNMLNERLPT